MTDIVFSLEKVSSNRVLTSLLDNQVVFANRNLYDSASVMGIVGLPILTAISGINDSHSLIMRFLPNNFVEFSDAIAGQEVVELQVNYTNSGTESFTEVFRFRARAIRPLQPPAVSALPSWGLALLVGVLIGVTLRVSRSPKQAAT